MAQGVEDEVALMRRAAHAVREALAKVDPERYGDEQGMGADGTLTEFVDTVAEQAILRTFDDAGERVNVLSEEIGVLDRGSDRTLVIDPVDGSKNAVRGIPLYCTSLAIAHGDSLSSVRSAFVLNLASGDEYTATAAGGATLNGRRLKPRTFDPKNVVVSTSLGQFARREALGLASKHGFNVRGFGSATLEMCFVAQGALDLYYFQPERLRITDIAASALIVKEAGGLVLTSKLEEFDMPLDLATRTSLAVATGKDVLRIVKEE